jgi:predicted nucleic acid-binding protein
MSKRVVDASVAVKWLVEEPLSDQALGVLGGSDELVAPDLFLAEIGNILWKKVRAGLLTPAMATERFTNLKEMGVTLVPGSGLSDRALALALETGRTMYDALYLALAEAEDCQFITADERLVNALSSTSIGSRTAWLGAL